MRFYIMIEAKSGIKLLRANFKATDGKPWTDDFSKAWFYHSREQAEDFKRRNQVVLNEEEAQKAMLDNEYIKLGINFSNRIGQSTEDEL